MHAKKADANRIREEVTLNIAGEDDWGKICDYVEWEIIWPKTDYLLHLNGEPIAFLEAVLVAYKTHVAGTETNGGNVNRDMEDLIKLKHCLRRFADAYFKQIYSEILEITEAKTALTDKQKALLKRFIDQEATLRSNTAYCLGGDVWNDLFAKARKRIETPIAAERHNSPDVPEWVGNGIKNRVDANKPIENGVSIANWIYDNTGNVNERVAIVERYAPKSMHDSDRMKYARVAGDSGKAQYSRARSKLGLAMKRPAKKKC